MKELVNMMSSKDPRRLIHKRNIFLESFIYRFAVYEALGVGKSLSTTVRSAKRLGSKHFIAAASRLAVQRLTIVKSLEEW